MMQKLLKVRLEPRLRVDSFWAVQQATLNGLGISMLPESLCLEHLRSGRLEQVPPKFLTTARCSVGNVFFSLR